MGRRARTTWTLPAGSAVAGVLGYVFFALVTRGLGSEAAAPVSLLWAWWGFAVASLTFPLQHWITRTVAAHGGERAVRAAARPVAAAALVVTCLSWAVSVLLRDWLFFPEGPGFPLLVAGVVAGSTLLGWGRGVLAARDRFDAVAAGYVAENGLRCLLAVALVLGGVTDPFWYGAVLVAGFGISLWWPSVYRLLASGDPGRESPLAAVAGVSGAQLVGQVVLTGGPMLLAFAGGAPAEVTALFAALALFRAPYTFALGVVAVLTGRITRLVVARDVEGMVRRRRLVLLASAGACVVAAVGGWFAGPWLLTLVFGPDVHLAARECLMVAVGSTLALTSLVFTIAVVAHGRTHLLAAAWVGAAVPGLAWFALGPGTPLERTCETFLIIQALACALLVLGEMRATRGLAHRHENHRVH